jgi:hypothetical protein
MAPQILSMMISSKNFCGSRGFEPVTFAGSNDFVKGVNQPDYTLFLNTHVVYVAFDVEWFAWYGISLGWQGASPRPEAKH